MNVIEIMKYWTSIIWYSQGNFIVLHAAKFKVQADIFFFNNFVIFLIQVLPYFYAFQIPTSLYFIVDQLLCIL